MKTITQEQADAYLAAVKAKYKTWNLDNEWDTAHDGDKPTLIWNWNDDGHPAIVWEGNSPYHWALYNLPTNYHDEEFGILVPGVPDVPGVYAEPYYSFVLILYPED